MKKEYEKKKKLVIFILAAVAVCLMGGLCFYLMKIGTPAEPEKDFVQQETKSFLDRVYRGSFGEMLTTMVKQEQLSEQDLKQLRQLLEETEEKG